jgi:hypothetical protein
LFKIDRFAPVSESNKQIILGASRAPFFSGFVASSALLWFMLSPSMATMESIFFYNLTLWVFALGGVVGGVTMMIVTNIGSRVIIGIAAATAATVLGGGGTSFAPMLTFPVAIGFALLTLMFSTKVDTPPIIVQK